MFLSDEKARNFWQPIVDALDDRVSTSLRMYCHNHEGASCFLSVMSFSFPACCRPPRSPVQLTPNLSVSRGCRMDKGAAHP